MPAKTIDATLRISAVFGKALTALTQFKGKIEEVNATAKNASGRETFKPMREGLESVSEQITRVKQQLLAFLGIGVGIAGVRALAELADSYSSMTARLRVATRGQQEFDTARAQSTALSKQYLQPLNETVTLYTRMLRAVVPLGGGTREAQVATEALLASIKLNGSTAAESASAILQFSQALGAGALRGEEFNAIAEAASPLLDALAAGLGKPRDQLKSLAEQGKLTTSAVIEALSRQLPELRHQAAQIPATIAGAAQGARDAFGQFVGQAAAGSEVVKTVIGLIRLLAENIEGIVKTLSILAVVLGSIKLAVFAEGLAAAGVAAAAGAAGLAAFGLALRGIAAVFLGPVGLIVLVLSLAAAWAGLDLAKSKAQDRTLERVRAERAAVVAELELLKERNKGGGLRSFDVNAELDAKRRLKALDVEIAQKQRQAFEDARRTDKASYGEQNTVNLRDPRTTADFEKDNATRLSVAKDFADKRAAYIVAKDRDIELARLQGDRSTEQRLLSEKRSHLAEQAKAEAEALKHFEKDSTVTRLAQVKDLYDQQADLVRDALAREIKFNEDAFAQGLVNAEAYLKARARLNAEQSRAELAELGVQLGKVRASYATNLKLPTKGLDANQRAERREGIAEQAEKIARLESDIEKKKRDQVDAERALVLEAGKLTDELRQQSRDLDIQLAEATGQALSPEQINQRVTAQFKEQLDRLRKLGGDEHQVLKLIDVEVTKQQLAQVEREFNRTLGGLQQKEQAINQDVAAGRLLSVDAEQQILALRRDEVVVLDKILARASALATSPEEKQRIENYRLQLQGFKDFELQLSAIARNSAVDGLKNALTDIVTGAKSGKDALVDMVAGFSRAILDALNKRLAQRLVDAALKALEGLGKTSNSSGDGWGAMLSRFVASFFHGGGIVGPGGGQQRAIPAAAFAFAPRYHSGGVAGLRPNEVPAVLLEGEEVLTADDPRHARNLGRGGATASMIGNLNVTVATDGTGSAAGDAVLARQLGGAIKMAIEQKLADEMRPGGMLQNVRRG